MIQLNRATCGRTFCRCIRQFKCLLDFQPADLRFQNAAGEDVFLPFFSTVSRLDRVQRNRVNQIAQGDAWLHSLRRTRTSTDSGISSGIAPVAAANATRPEPAGTRYRSGNGVRVATGTQRYPATTGQFNHGGSPSPGRSATPPRLEMNAGSSWLHFHVNRLPDKRQWQNDCITMSAEPRQARSFSSSRSSGRWCLASQRSSCAVHSRLPGRARPTFRQTTGAANHFSVLARSPCHCRPVLSADGTGSMPAGPSASRALAVRPRPMIRDTAAARTSSSNTSVRCEFGDHFAVFFFLDSCRRRTGRVDHIAHVHFVHVSFDRQAPASSTRVLKKIGAILVPCRNHRNACSGTNGISSPVNHSTELVADLRDEPVPHGVANVGNRVALGLQCGQFSDRADLAPARRFNARTGVFQHGQCMQQDVRTRPPRIRSRRQVVGNGFAGNA